MDATRSASGGRYTAQEVVVMLDLSYWFPDVINALTAATRWWQSLPFN
jgi:hypothetical protein